MRASLLLLILIALNSFGQFGPPIVIDPSSQLAWGRYEALDLDGDGDLDLIGRSFELAPPGRVTWYRNNGTGSFEDRDTLFMSEGGIQYAVADFNADGILDLLGYRHFQDQHELFWKEGSADASFGPEQFIADHSTLGHAPLNEPINAIHGADLNGDGWLDLIYTTSGGVQYMMNQLDGTFSTTVFILFEEVAISSPVVLSGDIDNDGDVDIMSVVNGSLYAAINLDGSGSNWSVHMVLPNFTGSGFNMILYDVDQDGDLDVVDHKNSIKWAENRLEEGEWGNYVSYFIRPEQGMPTGGSGALGQIGCHSAMSVLWTNWPYIGSQTVKWSNFDTAELAFTEQEILSGVMIGGMFIADLNGDGYNDLISTTGGVLRWYPAEIQDQPNVILILPSDTVGLNDQIFLLTGGAPEGGAYTLAGDTLSEFHPLAAGLGTHEIIYTYTDPFTGCTGSDTASVVVELSTSINNARSGRSLSIFPNPAADGVTIVFEATGSNSIVVHDAVGRVVDHIRLSSSPAQLDLGNYSSGAYNITLEQDGRRQHAVLIVESPHRP